MIDAAHRQGRNRGTLVVAAAFALACNRTPPPDTEGESSASDERCASRVSWQEPIEIAAGGGHVGPWRGNDSEFHYVDNGTVDLAADGATVVAWEDNLQQDVFLRRYDSRGRPTLPKPTNVSRSPGIFSWLPIVLSSEDGQVLFALWQEIIFSGGSHGGDILFARSLDGGRQFSEPLNLSRSKAGDGKGRLTEDVWHNGSLDLAAFPPRSLLAAWTDYEGSLWVSRSVDRGETFSAPLSVWESSERPARKPCLAAAPDGTIYLVWAVGGDPRADLRFAVSSDGGASFGAAGTLFAGDGHSDAPSIAVDGGGVVHLVYAEARSGMFAPHAIYYARLPDGTSASAAPQWIAGPGQDGAEGTGVPALSLSGEDTVWVTWEHYPEAGERPDGLGIAVSTDGGRSFSESSLIPGSNGAGENGGLQGFLMRPIDANDDGTVAVVSDRFQPDRSSRVRLIRGQLSR